MIDLNKLEAGDAVIFADDNQAIVASVTKKTHICGVRNSETMTIFYLTFDDEKYDYCHNQFFDDGSSHWFSNKKIVNVIKVQS